MDIPILFEDDDLFVINKPPGIVVNRAESVKGETVQDWMEKKSTNLQIYKSTNENQDFVSRAGIVHRIDKETSGCLLIAKTPQSFIGLQQQFKDRTVKKTYLALVHGKLVPQEGEIRAPVGRLPWNRERFGIVPGGKEAVTKYKIVTLLHLPRRQAGCSIAKNKKEDFSLVELYPETGRTHQIRVHLKYINHPIVGDFLYAGRKVSRDDRVWAPRVMLHAWKISFTHPNPIKASCLPAGRLAIEAPIPDDMMEIINKSTNGKSTNK